MEENFAEDSQELTTQGAGTCFFKTAATNGYACTILGSLLGKEGFTTRNKQDVLATADSNDLLSGIIHGRKYMVYQKELILFLRDHIS